MTSNTVTFARCPFCGQTEQADAYHIYPCSGFDNAGLNKLQHRLLTNELALLRAALAAITDCCELTDSYHGIQNTKSAAQFWGAISDAKRLGQSA
jgi:hypothetical protein